MRDKQIADMAQWAAQLQGQYDDTNDLILSWGAFTGREGKLIEPPKDRETGVIDWTRVSDNWVASMWRNAKKQADHAKLAPTIDMFTGEAEKPKPPHPSPHPVDEAGDDLPF